MSPKYHLVDLPDEILLSMTIRLSLVDLMSFMHSCRRLSALIAQSSLMQYLIRVMRNGLYDPLITDTSIPQRVEKLETWERAWIELSMSPPRRYRLPADLDDPKKCRVQSGTLIGTQFSGLRLSWEYCYLDFLHLLGQSNFVSRINIPNFGGDGHVQSWTYAAESNLIAVISQFVSAFLSHCGGKFDLLVSNGIIIIIELIDDVVHPNYSFINSLQATDTQALQITMWNSIKS